MHLESLRLNNFKNVANKEYTFSSKINAFVGNNGTGKTNTLDAIYYLCFCKSFLNYKDSANIKFGEDFFYLEGLFVSEENKDQVQLSFHKEDGKKLKNNQKVYPKLSQHIGKFPLVVISPYDRDLITEGSEIRKKFLDGILSQIDAEYLYDLIDYQKALTKRNALLKYFSANNCFSEMQLEPYNSVLIEKGTNIFEKRKAFLADFINPFQEIYSSISSDKEKVGLSYSSQLFEKDMKQLLQESISKDRMANYTTQGIHKDDLLFTLFDYPIKKTGSQGQQKSFLIALKLTQLQLIRTKLKRHPILIFDDIFDKLDSQRVKKLIELVNETHFGQMFLTDTDQNRTETILEQMGIENTIYAV